MYDNLIESLMRFRTTEGLGCILAHSMGLGKTLQVISFVDVFLRCVTGAQSVLIIVPVNTLQNWVSEFNKWLPAKVAGSGDIADDPSLKPLDAGSSSGQLGSNLLNNRHFALYVINDNLKTNTARAAVVGGILKLILDLKISLVFEIVQKLY
jgi:RAD54-like protein 2